MAESTTAEPLSPEHRQYLTQQAIDVDLAISLGVRSLTSRDDVADLPEPFNSWANFPAILFPWTGPDGRVEHQLRPDNPTEAANGRPRKYVFRKGMMPVLWALREGAAGSLLLIVEGTKQALAAASYAPEGVAVYGIAGCRSWQKDGMPIPDLAAAEDRDVVVVLDADAAGNPDVYAAGTGLAEALAMEGAARVLFGRLPASGKAGLDDVLAGRAPDKRAGYLARIISGAKPKPADRAPKPGRKGAGAAPEGGENRVTIICNRDRLEVINDLTAAMIEKWDGRELFNHGGVISRLRGTTMAPVDRGSSRDLIQETAMTVDEVQDQNGGTRYNFTWPDPNTISAVMSRSSKFSPLDRVSHAPFVRPDGTIVTIPGYDEATRTMLIPDATLEGVEVPEEPSPEQIRAALDLIMTEWLGDFPFDADADRANVLALIVTPAIRGLIPRVPLAVIDGLQMGVGKNLLADVILTVYTGQPARPMNFVDEKDELRKQLTSAFRTGAEFFVFDEAHTIEGAALAQALTAETWQDRILGVSTMAEFPNRVTWLSLGNQVQVRGDLTRRVYRVALRPSYANPQDRSASSFRHPGQSGYTLDVWTQNHRRELMGAILTLVRAWFSAGQPYTPRATSFGSFERWERIVGGIVQVAGLPGFLDNLKVWRSESDFDTQYWQGHLEWLYDQFGSTPFRTAEVRAKGMTDPQAYMAPPKLDDLADKGYGKALGEAYSRLRGRRYSGLYLDRVGSAHGHVSLWQVGRDGDTPPDTDPPPPAPEPEPEPGDGPEGVTVKSDTHPAPCGYPDVMPCVCRPDEDEDDTEVSIDVEPFLDLVTFDLETGDAGDLHRTGPGFVRLAGVADRDNDPQIFDGPGRADVTVNLVRAGHVVTGHNIMAFDFPALVREGSFTMAEVHRMAKDGRFFDAILAARYIDPPMARDKGVDATRKYDLDSLGAKYELGAKSDAAKVLAAKYGGWGAIPIDEESEDGRAFRDYLVQDVKLSRALYGRLMEELGEVPPYLVREHRVAALAAQISYNGFRVDVPELERRMTAVERRKAKAIEILAGRYNVPTVDAAGKPAKSPLATKGGKLAIEAALREAGATSIWRTATGELDTSVAHMNHLGQEYHHLKVVRHIAALVRAVVSARSVYETAHKYLAGDRVHPRISFDQATGRWSVKEPGLTVFGKHGGRHVEREVFLPDPGHVILAVDLSQVDMRAVAGLSGDAAYIDMLRRDDPHSEIAELLFGTRARRQDAKAIGHGWNYGRGIKAISEGQEIDPALVRQFDSSMRERFGRLVEWQDEVRALAESGALLDNGFGRPMRPDPRRAYTQGPALMGQGAARDIMTTGLLELGDRHPETLPMLRAQVHDEIVLSVPEEDAVDIGRAVVEALSFEWRGVPILADVSPVGTTWGAVYAKG